MSRSTVHNRGFFRLDVQMEGEPLIERKRHSDHGASGDVEAGAPAEYGFEPRNWRTRRFAQRQHSAAAPSFAASSSASMLGAVLNTGPVVFVRTLLADVVAPTTPSAAPRPLPAILKRIRTMQRATAGGDHGVSTESMLAAFPAWSQNGSIQVEDALKDVSLALVMLTNHLPSVSVLFEHVEL